MQITNLTFQRDGFRLGPVSCAFQPGGLYYFVGANGSGKSTLFQLLTGFLKPSQGSVALNGETDPWTFRREMALAFDESFYNPQLSGRDNLRITCYQRDINWEQVQPLIQGFHLEEGIKKKVTTYSFGMKKKLALIGALAANASVYIFDEPTSGLDLEASQFFYQEVSRRISQGKIILISTHVTSGFEPTPQALCLLEKGSIQWVEVLPELYSPVWFQSFIHTHYGLS